jgi:hypothetical protein
LDEFVDADEQCGHGNKYEYDGSAAAIKRFN